MLTKKSAKSLLLILLLPFLMSSSCHKKKEVPTYFMDQEFKDYCLFPLGSYWVYQDSASSSIDSVSLIKRYIFINHGGKSGYDFEQVDLNSSSSYYKDTSLGIGSPIVEEPTLYDYFEGSLNNYFMNNSTQFFSGHSMNYLYNYQQGKTLKYENFYDSLQINANKYKSVKIFTNTQSAAYLRQPRRIFYSKNIGVVRKEVFNGQVWNLIRYHIN